MVKDSNYIHQTIFRQIFEESVSIKISPRKNFALYGTYYILDYYLLGCFRAIWTPGKHTAWNTRNVKYKLTHRERENPQCSYLTCGASGNLILYLQRSFRE